MQHLTEQELVLHHYHDEDSPAAVAQHLAACDVCRAEYNSIQRVLALVDEIPIPERPEGYGEQVWTRLRWRLGSAGRRRNWRTALAAAAVVAVAFFAGQWWHAHNIAPANVATINAAAGKTASAAQTDSQNRILFVVVTDHLDSSERMLLQVVNSDSKRGLDLTSERGRAVELVASNRIYRQTAEQHGDDRLASLLSDLEPVLLEIAHSDGKLSPEEAASLQKRIDSKGLLFKVRVISAQTSGHEAPAAPQKGMTSL
jgi:anti-sigma-K factor RskA